MPLPCPPIRSNRLAPATLPAIVGLLASLALLAAPAAARGQQAMPWWVHVSVGSGAATEVGPGEERVQPAALLQMELSHELPIGFGLAGAWLAPVDGAEAGGFVEGMFAYRFPLNGAGRILPYAGAVAGVGWYGPLAREHFGGRAGLDLRLGWNRPFLRLEAAYRRLTEAGGQGARDLVSAALGLRLSLPIARGRVSP